MKFNQAHLLTALRKGPIDSQNWPTVATTRKALHVRVHQLREAGYVIESELLPNDGVIQTPIAAVAYHLRREPCCRRCGK